MDNYTQTVMKLAGDNLSLHQKVQELQAERDNLKTELHNLHNAICLAGLTFQPDPQPTNPKAIRVVVPTDTKAQQDEKRTAQIISENIDLKEANAALEREREQRYQEILACRSGNQQLVYQNQDLSNQIRDKKDQISILQSHVETLTHRVQELSNECDKQKTLRVELGRAISSAGYYQSHRAGGIVVLQPKWQTAPVDPESGAALDYKSAYEHANQANDTLSRVNTNLNNRVGDLCNHNQQLADSNQTLLNQFADKTGELTQAQTAIDKLEDELEHTQRLLTETQENCLSMGKEVSKLKEENESLKRSVDKIDNAMFTSLNLLRVCNENELKELRQENRKLLGDNAWLSTRLRDVLAAFHKFDSVMKSTNR